MIVFDKCQQLKLLSCAAVVTTVATVGWMPTKAMAFGFVPPPDNQTPRQSSAGGAARGNSSCPSASMLAGVPNTDVTAPLSESAPIAITRKTVASDTATRSAHPVAMLPAGSNYGKTIKSHPTLLVYVPPSAIDGLLLVLKDDADRILYTQEMAISEHAGILPIILPDEAPPLAVNQSYRWQIVFKCNGTLSPNSYFIEGWVERTALPTEMSFETSLPTDIENTFAQAASLSGAGIWYDSASTLALLTHLNTQDNSEHGLVISSWQAFLESVGLDGFIDVPIFQTERF